MPSIIEMNWAEPGKTSTKMDPVENSSEQTFRRFTPNGAENMTSSSTSGNAVQTKVVCSEDAKGSGQVTGLKMVKIRRKKKKRKAPSPPITPRGIDTTANALRKPGSLLRLNGSITSKQIWRMYRRSKTTTKAPPPPAPTSTKNETNNSNSITENNNNNNIDFVTDSPKWDNLSKPTTPPDLFETNWKALGKSMKTETEGHYSTINPVFDEAPIVPTTTDESVYWSEGPEADEKILQDISPTSTCISSLKRVERPLGHKKKRPAPPPPNQHIPMEPVSAIALPQPPAPVPKSTDTQPVITSPATVIPRLTQNEVLHFTSPEAPPPPPKNPPPLDIVLLDSPPPSPTTVADQTCLTVIESPMPSTPPQHLLTPPESSPGTSSPPSPPPLPRSLTVKPNLLVVPNLKTEILAASRKLKTLSSDGSGPQIKIIPPTPVPDSGSCPLPLKFGSPMNGDLKSELMLAVKSRALRRTAKEDVDIQVSNSSLIPVAAEGSVVSDIASSSQYPTPGLHNEKNASTAPIELETDPKSVIEKSYPSPLTQSLKEELLRVTSRKPETYHANYPSPISSTLKDELLRVVASKSDRRSPVVPPSKHVVLANEIKVAFEQREARRSNGTLSLRPFKSTRGSTVLKQDSEDRKSDSSTHSSQSAERRNSSDVLLRNMSKAEKKQTQENAVNQNSSWVPENDLPTDAFDDHQDTHTSRAAEFHQNWGEAEPPSHLYAKQKQKHNTDQKPKTSKMRRIQKGVRNVFGSLRRTFSSRESIRELSKEGWEIYPTSNFDAPPKSPVQISHVEHSPAYAFHSEKGELYLIPNFDKVLVTKDGTRIRERELAAGLRPPMPPQPVDISNPIQLGHVLQSKTENDSAILKIDEERKTLEEADTPFRVIQQMNASFKTDEGSLADSPISPVWKLVTSPVEPDKRYATVGSTASGWSDCLSNSPKKNLGRKRTTSVRLLQSDDSDACDSVPRYSRNNSFKILWRGTREPPEACASDRVVEGSESDSVTSPATNPVLDQKANPKMAAYIDFIKNSTATRL